MTLVAPKEAWRTVAQTFEFRHWSTARTRRFGLVDPGDDRESVLAGFREVSARIWRNFGFALDHFAGRRVLDIGPGPTGRCLALEGQFLGIEPLADKLWALPFADLDQYQPLYCQPAEEPIPGLDGTIDAVVSLNCFDHCYDLPAVLANAKRYLRVCGFAFFSFDVDKPAEHDPTHPLKMSHEEAATAIRAAGFRVDRISSGRCYPSQDGTWRDNWGGGTAYHFWCEKEL